MKRTFPTKQPQAQAKPRISCPDGDQGRAQDPQATPRQGKGSPERVVVTGRASRVHVKLSPRMRLTGARQFTRVFKRARRFSTGAVTVLAEPNPLGHPRLGLAISRRHVKRAVGRNRIKRVVRESFRAHQGTLDSLDVVVLTRAGIETRSNDEIRAWLELHWKRLKNREGLERLAGRDRSSNPRPSFCAT